MRIVFALLTVLAIGLVAQPSVAQTTLVTPPVSVAFEGGVRCNLFNGSGVELTDISVTVHASLTNEEANFLIVGDVQPSRGKVLSYVNPVSARGYHCVFQYEGPCDDVYASVCAVDSPAVGAPGCLEARVQACTQVNTVMTGAVHMRPFLAAACAVTNTGPPTSVVATIVNGAGDVVAGGQQILSGLETMTVRHMSFVGGDFSCRVVSLSEPDSVRARIYLEDYQGNSMDGSPAR